MRPQSAVGVLLAAGGIGSVSAHGYIDKWTISNQTYGGYNPTIAPWVPDQGTITWPAWNTDTGPVYGDKVNTSDIICSINATNAKIYAAPVEAGTALTLHWTVWPDSHHGPILTYLAACDGDCATADKEALRWFKIEERGQIALGPGGGTTGLWAADDLIEAGGDWTVKIPASIRAGNYVLRHEIIALHSAYDVGGAQFYPQCANIRVTGGGDVAPEGVLGTELYEADEPGVHYNIYNDETEPVYRIPGPPLCK
ncbi:lytic polysaccharide monooxygenase [Nemania sp. NC0429]|nr:lytic polysaccharide monooxygenase [Nemania sp. NC0429]